MESQTLSQEQVIYRITNWYHSGYDPLSSLSAWEQLEICESIAETEKEYVKRYGEYNDNVNVNDNVNDTCKHKVNFNLSSHKLGVLLKLQNCNYRTSPILISTYLEEFFKENPSNEGHWLYIAQTYPPRPIVRTIESMIKAQERGFQTIKNPAAYFTSQMKYRVKRKSLLTSKKKNQMKDRPVLQGQELAVE